MEGDGVKLDMITNRGVKVWPGTTEAFLSDHWRCRFVALSPTGNVSHNQLIRLLSRINEAGYDFIKIENLYTFDGQPGFGIGGAG
jgi:isocitrate dehydrogenase